jgi:hypothetical protein
MGRTVGRGNKCPECGTTRKTGHNAWIRTGEWQTCYICNGTAIVPEDRFDYLPAEILSTIPLQVIRLSRGMTFNESLLGMGCVWACQDYGKTWDMTDRDILAMLRVELDKRSSVQACTVVDKGDALAGAIGIFVNRGGYSLRTLTPKHMAQVDQEFDYATGMRGGMRVYSQGGNGTLAGTGITRELE